MKTTAATARYTVSRTRRRHDDGPLGQPNSPSGHYFKRYPASMSAPERDTPEQRRPRSCGSRCMEQCSSQACAAPSGCGLCCGSAGDGISGVAVGLISSETTGPGPAFPSAPSWREVERLLRSPEQMGWHVVEFCIDEAGRTEAAPGSFDVAIALLPHRPGGFPSAFLGTLVTCVHTGGLLVAVMPISAAHPHCSSDTDTECLTPEAVRAHLIAGGCRHAEIVLSPGSAAGSPPRWAAVTATTPPHRHHADD